MSEIIVQRFKASDTLETIDTAVYYWAERLKNCEVWFDLDTRCILAISRKDLAKVDKELSI